MLEYEGEWVQGVRQGHGTREYASGESYEGDFSAGMRHGHGRYAFANTDIYAGEWVDDRRSGHGTYFYANGDVFIGKLTRYIPELKCICGRVERRRCSHSIEAWGSPKVRGMQYHYINIPPVPLPTLICTPSPHLSVPPPLICPGNFIKDRKEGRGTLFMMSRQRKCVPALIGSALAIGGGFPPAPGPHAYP